MKRQHRVYPIIIFFLFLASHAKAELTPQFSILRSAEGRLQGKNSQFKKSPQTLSFADTWKNVGYNSHTTIG